MTTPPRAGQRVFLEKRTYRQRRVMDAARLLPVLGAVALFVPLLWPVSGTDGVMDPVTGVPMSRAMAYVFGVWLLLICLAGIFAAVARRWFRDEPGRSRAGHERPGHDQPGQAGLD